MQLKLIGGKGALQDLTSVEGTYRAYAATKQCSDASVVMEIKYTGTVTGLESRSPTWSLITLSINSFSLKMVRSSSLDNEFEVNGKPTVPGQTYDCMRDACIFKAHMVRIQQIFEVIDILLNDDMTIRDYQQLSEKGCDSSGGAVAAVIIIVVVILVAAVAAVLWLRNRKASDASLKMSLKDTSRI